MFRLYARLGEDCPTLGEPLSAVVAAGRVSVESAYPV